MPHVVRSPRPERGARCALVLVLALAACASSPPGRNVDDGFVPDHGRHDVRVALADAVRTLEIELDAPLRMRGDGRSAELAAGTVVFRSTPDGITVVDATGRPRAATGPLRVDGREGRSWRYEARPYAGDAEIRRQADGTLTLVNHLDIETYLRGVVPHEIGRPSADRRAAVEAQAIAARTYTYGRLGRWDALGFDVYADVRDQVYRGLHQTAEICDRAIANTRGRVLAYDGALARAYYSSLCGGHTSTLVDVWTRQGGDYLVGFRDADRNGRSWCRQASSFRWSEVWSAKELGDQIREYLPAELDRPLAPEDIGVIRALRVARRDRSGRVQELEIVADGGTFTVWGDRIRWVLRPVESRWWILRSTFFELDEVTEDGRIVGWIARGGGNGHGVGMCQNGALARAAAGQDADTILRSYYRGAEVVDVHDLGASTTAR